MKTEARNIPAFEVRWLSRRNATKRLFEMKNEMLLLSKELGQPHYKDLENDEFVQRLAYLSDILKLSIS